MTGPPAGAALTVGTSWLAQIASIEGIGVLGGFIVGSIPFAYLLGRARGLDLRKLGSGNVGATNLGRNAGLAWGVLAFFLDAAKGAGPVLWVIANGGGEGAAVLAGSAAVLGHCFSPFLNFRGGKGVASMAGVLAALAPVIFLCIFAFWGGVVAVRRDIGLASVLSSLVGIGAGIWVYFTANDPRPWLVTLLLVLPVVVITRHRSNIRTLLANRGESK